MGVQEFNLGNVGAFGDETESPFTSNQRCPVCEEPMSTYRGPVELTTRGRRFQATIWYQECRGHSA